MAKIYPWLSLSPPTTYEGGGAWINPPQEAQEAQETQANERERKAY